MEPVHVREISNEEGDKLLGIVRRGNGSIVTWQRAQILLWSAQGLDTEDIAPLTYTTEDRVRSTIDRFNDAGIDSLHHH
jgi:hypothetical protein